jgi:hypothetical protein
MHFQTSEELKYVHRIDSITVRKRKNRKRDIGLWFISVKIDLKRLLARRGGHDLAIETYLRIPKLIRHSNSTAIGEDVELTFEERRTLKITSIRPCDITWRECRRRYKKERNRRKRELGAIKRRIAGIRPLSESLSRTKPWEAEGLSRTVWYRRRKEHRDNYVPPRGTTECHPPLTEVTTSICPSTSKDGQPSEPSLPTEITQIEPPRGESMMVDDVAKEARKTSRKAKKAENAAFHEKQRQGLPETLMKLMEERVSGDNERIAEQAEEIRALQEENATLKAENLVFQEMKIQWQIGGFEAVIAGKDQEIRALVIRVASESREKARNLRSSQYWQAEAIKCGYSRNVVIDIDTGEVIQ